MYRFIRIPCWRLVCSIALLLVDAHFSSFLLYPVMLKLVQSFLYLVSRADWNFYNTILLKKNLDYSNLNRNCSVVVNCLSSGFSSRTTCRTHHFLSIISHAFSMVHVWVNRLYYVWSSLIVACMSGLLGTLLMFSQKNHVTLFFL